MQRQQIALLKRLDRDEFIVGRCTASAMASASRKSFLWPLRKGLKYWAGIRRTSGAAPVKTDEVEGGLADVQNDGGDGIG